MGAYLYGDQHIYPMFAYKALVSMQSEVPYMGTRFVYHIFTLTTTYADRFFVDASPSCSK